MVRIVCFSKADIRPYRLRALTPGRELYPLAIAKRKYRKPDDVPPTQRHATSGTLLLSLKARASVRCRLRYFIYSIFVACPETVLSCNLSPPPPPTPPLHRIHETTTIAITITMATNPSERQQQQRQRHLEDSNMQLSLVPQLLRTLTQAASSWDHIPLRLV